MQKHRTKDERRLFVRKNLENIEKWASNGLTIMQLCEKLQISNSYFLSLRREFPEMEQAYQNGRKTATENVENALYRLCTGYDYEETIITNDGKATKAKKVWHPNVTAIQFWLKNKQPDLWRDKNEVELSGEVKSIFEELAKEDGDAGTEK